VKNINEILDKTDESEAVVVAGSVETKYLVTAGSRDIHGHEAASLITDCTIDFSALKHLGFMSPDDRRSRQAEEYRMIKRPLLNNAFGKEASLVERGNLIMVTSSMPGEGKTFTSINLAISMAKSRILQFYWWTVMMCGAVPASCFRWIILLDWLIFWRIRNLI